jgi:hypothetical protein
MEMWDWEEGYDGTYKGDGGKKGGQTGNCAPILCNCSGLNMPVEARNSSSVLMVLRERLSCAGSAILNAVQHRAMGG